VPQALVLFFATSTGFTALGTAAGGLTLLGNIVAGAVGLGINFGIQALFGPKGGPKPPEIKTVVQQSVPNRVKHMGRVRAGGKLLMIETRDRILHQVVYICQGEIDAFEEFYLDNRLVRLIDMDEDGFVRIAPFGGAPEPGKDNSLIRVQWRVGTDDQLAFPIPIEELPEIWTEDHRALGCALIYGRSFAPSAISNKFTKVYPNRYTVFNAVLRGSKIYDPRTETRAFSENLVVMLHEYLTDKEGMQIDLDYIDAEEFSEGADHADDIIPTKDGTTRRYWGSFTYELDSEPGDNVKRLLQATAGRIYLKPNGKIGYKPGKWHEPTVSIPDSALTYCGLVDRSGPLKDANEIIVQYTNPNARYSQATAQPWRDEEDISASGQRKTVPLEALEVNNHNHARRLAKLEARRRAPRWQGPIRTNLAGLQAWDQPTIFLSVEDLEIENEPFEVLKIAFDDETMEVSMMVASLTSEAFGFDPETEEGTAPTDPDDLDPDAAEVPANVEAHCEQRVVAGGQSVAVLVATWDQPDDGGDEELSYTADAQYSVADANVWQNMAINSNNTRAEVIGIADGVLYDVRVRWALKNGEPSNWVVIENVQAIADADAPPTPLSFTATQSLPNVDLAATAADSPANTAFIQFLRRGPGVAIGSATLITKRPATPGATRAATDVSVVPGVWSYCARAENASGVLSAATADDVEIIAGTVFSDNFTRANQNLEASSNWTRVDGTAGAGTVTSNAVSTNAPTSGDYAAFQAPRIWTPNHYAKCTTTFTVTLGSFFIAVRVINKNNFVGIRWSNGSGGQWQLFKLVAGSGTFITTAVQTTIPVVGTVCELRVLGDNAKFVVNGATIIAPTAMGLSGAMATADSSGLISRGVEGTIIDNFECGTVVTL
jgi:hypothetical protein